jgi:hypothetical protein
MELLPILLACYFILEYYIDCKEEKKTMNYLEMIIMFVLIAVFPVISLIVGMICLICGYDEPQYTGNTTR